MPQTPSAALPVANPLSVLFGAKGRIGRASFVLGLVLLVALPWLARQVLGLMDSASLARFLFGLVFFCLYIYMVTCVFVQRLHDMGRSAWLYTGWLVAIVMVLIGVMLAYGGAEYFDGFAQFERKEAIDPAVVEELRTTYEAELARGLPTLNLLLTLLIGGFAVVLAVLPGERGENRYGLPPGTATADEF